MEEERTPESLVAGLVKLLEVKNQGDDQFIGRKKRGGIGRVFGGQVIAQALHAAEMTVDPSRPAHSLHAYFLRGGSEGVEVDYRVERDFDGGSFSNRRVVASQQGRPILNLTASFQKYEDGLHHVDSPMPDVPPPEELEPEVEVRRRYAEQARPEARRHRIG